MNKVKKSAIPFSGYSYQTLQGMAWLTDWLASPTRYLKMKFECSVKSDAPQGIDDIVAWRADGKVDYAQVKFTPSPEKNPLTWDWLLELPDNKRPRSLVMKWQDALAVASQENLGRVVLITNREPDEQFGRCLNGTRIVFEKLPKEIVEKLASQLGNETAVRRILVELEIQHSDRGYLQLHSVVLGNLLALGYDDSSFHRLLTQSTHWATFESLPAPEGFITLDIVRAVLSTQRPAPISQEFEVPDRYIPPDDAFHRDLLSKISRINDPKNLHLLCGPPGRGKSTYLSYLAKQLEALAIPVIRHHYFLSTTDKSSDRIRLHAVASSLLSQIKNQFSEAGVVTEDHRELRCAIARCAEYFRDSEKPLVVIIDGLDHVWRHEHDTRPLNELFQQLMPVPANVHLIIGTQPVSDEELPEKLVLELPRRDWTIVPLMSLGAVRTYVTALVKSRRWIRPGIRRLSEHISRAAQALHKLTDGHPLHLIFSVEELLQKSNPPTELAIEALSACPNNDIRKYYQQLWLKLTDAQQNTLHLICELPFHWPQDAFYQISSMGVQASLNGITHLLHESAVGYRPFHDSLTVFVASNTSHHERISRLLGSVETWLETQAPSVIRHSWLYSLKAKRGNYQQLVDVLTRDWVLDRLTEGYPTSTMLRLLKEAEQHSFDNERYADAYRLRALKTRIINGPQFQINETRVLQSLCWSVSTDNSLLDETIANVALLSTEQQGSLSRALQYKGDARGAKIARKALDRFVSEYRYRYGVHDSQLNGEYFYLVEQVAATDTLRQSFLSTPSAADNADPSALKAIISGLVRNSDIAALFTMHEHATRIEVARQIEESIFFLAVSKAIDLSSWGEVERFWASDLVQIFLALKKTIAIDRSFQFVIHVPALSENKGYLGDGVHSFVFTHFFRLLGMHCMPKESVNALPLKRYTDDPTLLRYLSALERVAETAAAMLKSGQPVQYDFVFEAVRRIERPSGYYDYKLMEQYQEINKALHNIAMGCHFLSTAVGGCKLISLASYKKALDTSHLIRARFLENAQNLGARTLEPALLDFLISQEIVQMRRGTQQVNEVIENLLLLAQLSLTQQDDSSCRTLCRLIWDLVLGYGHHKDTTILELLEGIRHVGMLDPRFGINLLQKISGVIDSVTDFTDGDETGNAHGWAARTLRVISAEILVKKYLHLLVNNEWYRAQETLRHALKNIDVGSPYLKALARTGLLADDIPYAKVDAEPESSEAVIQGITKTFLGKHQTFVEPEHSNAPLTSRFTAPFETYAPSNFLELLKDLRDSGNYFERDYLVSWYEYWKAKKHSTLAKHLLRCLFEKGSYNGDAKYLLDHLYESTLTLFGREKAFEVVMKAHVELHGWAEWAMFERSEASMERLRKVAATYPERAREFVRLTCTTPDSTFGNSEYVIPGARLVYFFAQSGDVENAKSLASAMVENILDETRNMELWQAEWATETASISEDELPLHLLVVRLKSGVATIRLWAIQELVGLLITPETCEKTERVLRSYLSDIQLDTDLTEVLSIFVMAYQRGFEAKPQLHLPAVGCPLTLALARRLGAKFSKHVVLAAPDGFVAEKRFFEVDGLPKRVIFNLERMQSKIDFPFMSQASFEATRLSRVLPHSGDVRFFFRGIRENRSGALVSNATQIARSAYLRTLTVAESVGRISKEKALIESEAATPFNAVLLNLRPNQPAWWPILGEIFGTQWAEIPSKISTFLKATYQSPNVLGAISTPIHISLNEFVVFKAVLCACSEEVSGEQILGEVPLVDDYIANLISHPLAFAASYSCERYAEIACNQKVRALAGKFMILPHGYLHTELLVRGVYLPTSADAHDEFLVCPDGPFLLIHLNAEAIGKFSYWNVEWSPGYSTSKGPGCATLLELEKVGLQRLLPVGHKLIYRCSATFHRRDHHYQEFEAKSAEQFIVEWD